MLDNRRDLGYRRLFETIHIGILILDIKTRIITDANPYIAEMSGYKVNELIGKKISEVGLFDKAITGKKIFDDLKKLPEVTYDNTPLVPKTGSIRVVELDAHTYETEGQKMIQCTVRDLTEKRKAQRELFETNQRLEALMDAIPAGIAFSLDPNAEQIKANTYLTKKLEISSHDNISAASKDKTAVGKKLRHIMNGRELEAHELPIQRAIAAKKVVGPFEITIETPSGKQWIMEGYGAPVYDKLGKVIGAVSINMDLTDRKKAEEAEKLSILVKQEKEKMDFIADAAHELRTPLAIIRGNVDLVLHRGADSRDALISINEEVLHLTDLLSDLSLITTKESAFRQKLSSNKKVDVNQLLHTLRDRHMSFAQKKDIKIHIDHLPHAEVVGDDFYLERLFTNIITNAVSYGKEHGNIWIRGKINKDCLCVMIEDDGVGISETDLPHIFERFYRAESSRSKDFGGSGLGLAIVKWIAEAHHGTVSVSSEVGKGSTFTVSLPLPKITPKKTSRKV